MFRTAFWAIVLTISLFSAGDALAIAVPRPSGFIPNHGQWPTEVLFAARTPTLDVFVRPNGMTFTRVRSSSSSDAGTNMYEASWAGSSGAKGATFHSTGSIVAFYRGATSHTVDMADRVVLKDVYRGVDVVYTLQDGKLRFDLDVRPGGDVAAIALQWPAGISVAAEADGRQAMVDNALVLGGLYVEQEGQPLPSRFAVTASANGGHRMTVDIVGYDPTKRLLIDPIVYGAYLGSNAADAVAAIKYTSRNEIIVSGSAVAITFPGADAPVKHGGAGEVDGFVARLDATMTKVLAYAYVGGSENDRVRAMCIDGSNSVYLTGETQSKDFPTSSGVSGQVYRAGIDVFIVKLDSNLAQLKIGTYHGGNRDETPSGIAVDRNQTIYIAGTTTSTANLPVTFPVTVTVTDSWGRRSQEPGGGANLGGKEGFLASYTQAGTLLQGRYFGRTGNEEIKALTVDNSSGVYVTGSTTSTDFETAPTSSRFSSGRLPYDRTFNGGTTDAFVAKFNNELALAKRDDGTYSTYLGGSGDEEGRGVFVDDLGRAYVVGVTKSPNLESISALNTTLVGGQDVFLAVMSDDGRDLKSLTYYGGTADDHVLGVVPYTASTTAVIYGYTVSPDFPTTGGGASSNRAGNTDGFVALINTTTNRHCTLIGGTGDDTVRVAEVDPKGDVIFGISTTSSDLPLHKGSFGNTNTDSELFLGKFAYGTLDLTSPRGGESYCIGNAVSITWQAQEMPTDETYAVDLSTDNGETWTEVAKGITTRSYAWRPTALAPGSTYKLRVRTQRGHVSQTGSPFTLTLPPKIDRQPVSASACIGQPVTLSVEASGTNVKYQWRRNGSNLSGATNATYQFTLAANSIGKYDCVVTGTCNPQVNSAVVDVTEAAPTAITKQPQDITVDEGSAFELSVTATGGTLAYQWFRNDTPIEGATSASLRVIAAKADDAAGYRCVVTGGCGVVTSEVATVRVNRASSVTDDLSVVGVRILGPQPANDVLRLAVDGSAEVLGIRIIDLSGRVVMMPTAASAQIMHIPVLSLAPSTYVLEVTTAGNSARGTFVIQR